MHSLSLRCLSLHCLSLHCLSLHCLSLHCLSLHCLSLHCLSLHCLSPYVALKTITASLVSLCSALVKYNPHLIRCEVWVWASALQPHTHTLTHSHTFTITCTCCYDHIKGAQDQDLFSFSDSLLGSQMNSRILCASGWRRQELLLTCYCLSSCGWRRQ